MTRCPASRIPCRPRLPGGTSLGGRVGSVSQPGRIPPCGLTGQRAAGATGQTAGDWMPCVLRRADSAPRRHSVLPGRLARIRVAIPGPANRRPTVWTGRGPSCRIIAPACPATDHKTRHQNSARCRSRIRNAAGAGAACWRAAAGRPATPCRITARATSATEHDTPDQSPALRQTQIGAVPCARAARCRVIAARPASSRRIAACARSATGGNSPVLSPGTARRLI